MRRGRHYAGYGIRPSIAMDLLARQHANQQHQQEAIDELRPLTDRQATEALSAAFETAARRVNAGTVAAPAGMVDHDTYNTCPDCDTGWKDAEPTPGILHRTRICDACRQRSAETSLRTLGGAR